MFAGATQKRWDKENLDATGLAGAALPTIPGHIML